MTAFAIHCDASQSRGMGHIVRQIHLGRVLRDKGATLLFSQDMVICSGGVTLHEVMEVGTPAITISQVPHQDKNAQDIECRGAIINLGLGENFDPARLLSSLQIPATELQKMSLTGKNLIDGQGINRVASAILSL